MIWAKGKNTVAGLFYRCGGMVQGFVRSPIVDPDLRSPSGFDSGLRPPLRMTQRGGVMLFHCWDNHYAMVAPHCLLTYNAETNESLLQWEKVAADG